MLHLGEVTHWVLQWICMSSPVQTMWLCAALFVQKMDLSPLHTMETCFDVVSVGYTVRSCPEIERFLQEAATAQSREVS